MAASPHPLSPHPREPRDRPEYLNNLTTYPDPKTTSPQTPVKKQPHHRPESIPPLSPHPKEPHDRPRSKNNLATAPSPYPHPNNPSKQARGHTTSIPHPPVQIAPHHGPQVQTARNHRPESKQHTSIDPRPNNPWVPQSHLSPSLARAKQTPNQPRHMP
eukprot:355028-Chlamydomonas_euryale.AAC.2